MQLADRISRIQPSLTLTLDARAKELIAAGKDVVNMAVGEPDFAAPACVREATLELAASGRVRYTPAAGTPGLRSAIAEHLSSTRGGHWKPSQVCVCHSAKHALSASLMCLVQAGDEVLLPLPAWTSYFDQVRLTGAKPIAVDSPVDGAGFHPDFKALRAAITKNTRVLMINSPNNPSGTVWSREEMIEIAKLALEHDLWILSDEIYRALVYDGEVAQSPSGLLPGSEERTLIVDGASKCFAMTGYRMGFVAGPEEFISNVAKLNSQTNGAPNSLGQFAYERALCSNPPEVEQMRRTYAQRRAVLMAGLAQLDLPTPDPKGAFYAFPNLEKYMDERGSMGLCADLLEEQLLALIPGAAFGIDTHIRLSFATDLDSIREALRRLGAFLNQRG